MEFSGYIKAVRYKNEENGYTVASMETEDGDINIVGYFSYVDKGEYVKIFGELTYSDKYGEQVKVESVEVVKPSNEDSIRNYLSQGAISNIGPVLADRIVDRFGEKSLEIIENEPERLLEVQGIGQSKLKKIIESMKEQRNFSKVIVEIQSLGISPGLSNKIYAVYKDDSVNIIKENPYKLIEDIRGVGFKTADEIALKNGISKEDGLRILKGVEYVLNYEAQKSGHTCLPKESLMEKAEILLEVSKDLIENNFKFMILKSVLNFDMDMVYSSFYHTCEVRAANKLIKFVLNRLDGHDELEIYTETDEVSEAQGIKLTDEQKQAVQNAINNQVSIITGGPGTGKTAIIKTIVKIFEKKGKKVLLCAPTGRAAKRIEESTSFEAQTIHRLLGYKPFDDKEPDFEHDETNQLKCDLLIVDESSMLDIILFSKLLEAIKGETSIVFVGDADQLPSVSAGNVLRDMIESETIKTVKLNKIFRQKKDSGIAENAHKINKGEFPSLNDANMRFYFIDKENAESIKEEIGKLVSVKLPNYYKIDSIEDIQVLTPMKKDLTGVRKLNSALQNLLNPMLPNKNEIVIGDRIFREKDKVMQLKNNYNLEYTTEENGTGSGIFNGDIGYITSIDALEGRVNVIFDNEKVVELDRKALDDIDLAYAMTIHKSQGSEFKVVVLPIWWGSPMLMTRNLIYTAITRAKNVVVMVGNRSALKRMIDNDLISERYSKLRERLVNGVEKYRPQSRRL